MALTNYEMHRVRPRLVEFTAQMLDGLPRKDQRAKGELYVRGLLGEGRRKSMQPMAERLKIDYQQFQQFITSSTWDCAQVRRNVAAWAVPVVGPAAYAVDDTGLPKDGDASPCVAHQYCGQLGKTTNCQVAVSIQMVTDAASLAVDWRLFCPKSWDDRELADPAEAEAARRRREKAKLPDEARHREKWRLALDMLDEATGAWGLPKLPVAADSGYGDVTAFRAGLEDRGLEYAVAVSPTLSAHPADAVPTAPPYSGRGRPPVPKYRDRPSTLGALALAAGEGACQKVTWRQGTKKSKDNPDAEMRSRFLALPVRPANRDVPRADDGSLPLRTLLAEWPEGADKPTDFWLSNLPADTPLPTLVRLAKIRWRVEHDYRELKTGLGLGHFEGRTHAGWNRHATLVCLAQAFCTLLRLDPKAPAPA
jgi:SRSO17 transposase